MTNQTQTQVKKDPNAITEADLPTPDLDNRTELDVLFFNTLNQHHAGFHVVAAKVGYRIGDAGPDGYASVQLLDEAVKLATADQHYEDDFRHSVKYESDLAPHKPACDVLVAGTAYAPAGKAVPGQWYWDAQAKAGTTENSLAAPHIVYAGQDFTMADFTQTLSTGQMATPAGVGAIGRGCLPRCALVGTVDENKQWQTDEVPGLPMDFDFAYWNAAPKDQQCPYLQGGEEIRLLNLSAPGAGIGKSDATGNQHVKFRLPHHACVLLLGIPQNGEEHLQVERMVIDTVLIMPDQRRLELTWRSLIEVERDVTQMRFLFLDKPEQLLRIKALENIAEMNRDKLTGSHKQNEVIGTAEKNLPQGRT